MKKLQLRYAMRINLAVACGACSRWPVAIAASPRRLQPAAPAHQDLEAMHADAPGIAWFKGSAEAALAVGEDG